MTKEKMREMLESKKKFQWELHAVIANPYAQKATEAMDKLAAEKGWTQETYDGWLKEHNRTPYQ